MGRFAPAGSLSPIGRVTDKALARLRIACEVGNDDAVPSSEIAACGTRSQENGRDGERSASPKRVRSRSREQGIARTDIEENAVDLVRASLERLRAGIELSNSAPRRGQRPASAVPSLGATTPARPSSAPHAKSLALQRVEDATDESESTSEQLFGSCPFNQTGMDTIPSSRAGLDACSPHRVQIGPGQYRPRWTSRQIYGKASVPDLKRTTGRYHSRTPNEPETEDVFACHQETVSGDVPAQGKVGGALPPRRDSTFLTGIDCDETVTSIEYSRSSPRHGLGQMSLSTSRPDLAKGPCYRHCIQMHESKADVPFDVLRDGDIKLAPTIRNPEWDFQKTKGRSKLPFHCASSEPGKYENGIQAASPIVKSILSFDDALLHTEQPVTCWGHQTVPAVLHPEHRRSPGGCVVDRSLAKNCVANRITNVNDFPRELARPPMHKPPQQYCNEADPDIAALVLWQEMTFDASAAVSPVMPRKDVGPSIGHTLPRGRQALQGSRLFNTDRALLGAHGLCFKETMGQCECTVEQRESRAADGSRMRPGTSPDLGTGLSHAPESPARRKLSSAGFRRTASSPGFVTASRAIWSPCSSEARVRERTILGSCSLELDAC